MKIEKRFRPSRAVRRCWVGAAVLAVFAWVVVSSAGCGRPSRGPVQPQDGGNQLAGGSKNPDDLVLETDPASLLEIGFSLSSPDNWDFPDPKVKLRIPDPDPDEKSDRMAKGTLIEFRKNVFFPKPKGTERLPQLFLVFTKNFGSRSIASDAFFSHVVLNAADVPRGGGSREPVGHDGVHGLFFVNLSKLFAHPEIDADLSEKHLIVLDLMLSDGKEIRLNVHFRLKGWLPVGGLQSGLNIRSWGGITKYHLLVGSEFLLGDETYRNPSARPVRLWISMEGGGGMVGTLIRLLRWVQYGEGPLVGPVPKFQLAMAKWQLASLLIWRSSSEKWEKFPMGGGNGWVDLKLAPYETVRWLWQAGFSNGTVKCNLPPPETYYYHGGPPQTYPWIFAGASMDGSWSRKVRVSDWNSDSDLVKARELDTKKTEDQVGEIASNTVQLNEGMETRTMGGVKPGCGYFY